MQKVTNKLEEFFWLFLFINPFLDIGNGLFIMVMENLYDRTWEQINLAFTPSLLIRMTVLVLFGLYLLLSWDTGPSHHRAHWRGVGAFGGRTDLLAHGSIQPLYGPAVHRPFWLQSGGAVCLLAGLPAQKAQP